MENQKEDPCRFCNAPFPAHAGHCPKFIKKTSELKRKALKPYVTKPKPPLEHDEQVAYFQWVDIMIPIDSRYKQIFAVPNGAAKSSWYMAKRMKKEGVKKGVSDIIILQPSGNFHGAIIEMKRKGNSLSPEQRDFIDRTTKLGYAGSVCWSVEEAINFTKSYFAMAS